MRADETVVVKTVLHDSPAGLVEFVECVGKTYRTVSAH
ncbi:MAG: hypothetical protein QOJ84_1790, partial [Bradyrhizobium sp.]|nr:hypothetical protein [Bradyrhizobium sp.]